MNTPNLDVRLTHRQAERLSKLSGVPAQELRHGTIAELAERYKFTINPRWWLFERVCGRVVKTNPVTGVDYPVPYATVHVQDNDCSFIGYFPTNSKWSWLFPFYCSREDIGVTTTDACGNFCVWIFRFDIDWILEWRREHICFPDIFVKPSIRDILNEILQAEQQPPVVGRPPLPDPPPSLLANGGQLLRRVEQVLGSDVAQKLAVHEATRRFGGSTGQVQQLLDSPAFPAHVPPPLAQVHLEHLSKRILPEAAAAAKVNIDTAELTRVHPRSFVGPFYRCFDVYLPEWVPIIGAPDITFEVTQDVNGDGNQEVIYSEGYFDIRWDAVSIPNVTLHASQIALAGLTCETPPVTCDNTVPGIQFAGLMPLTAPYQDVNSGYALRPNRPHPSGDVNDPPLHPPYPASTAPYTGTLQLYGCSQVEGAVYYRVQYSFNGSLAVPFSDLPPWKLHRSVGNPPVLQENIIHPVDANGWYTIIPEADHWFPDHLLLNWPTQQEGVYSLTLQLADGSKNVIYTSPTPINIFVDNSGVKAQFTALEWRTVGTLNWNSLDFNCPVIDRPTGHDIEIRVTFNAWADHFRDIQLGAGGCEPGNAPQYITGSTEHWYTGLADNNFSNAANPAVYLIPRQFSQGSYTFNLGAAGRAFNPSGGDGGFEADWFYDPVYAWASPSIAIAVVDV